MQEEYRTVIRRMASPLGLDKCFMETKETHTCHRTPEPSKDPALSKTSVLATSEVTNSTAPVGVRQVTGRRSYYDNSEDCGQGESTGPTLGVQRRCR